MELSLVQASGGSAGSVSVNDAAFGAPFNEALVHQVVTAYLASARAGTKAQKSRAAVRGGGAKPFRQKGTGRARAGTIRGPLWRGGGVTFAATPRSYAQKVNRKMYQGALRAIVSELARQERLVVVEDFALAEARTKVLASSLAAMGLKEVLIVVTEHDDKLILASRNLPNVGVCTVRETDPVSLVAFDKVLITVPALKQLEGQLA